MKRTLITSIFSLLLCALITVEAGCGSTEKKVHTPPTLLILGADLTTSTHEFQKIDSTYLRMSSEVLFENGGSIILFPIGKPTDKPGLRCEILPLEFIDGDITLDNQEEIKDRNSRIIKQNAINIETFIKAANEMLRDSNQNITDIAGFFKKADMVLNEPQYNGFSKYLFISSDGIQSVNNINMLCTYHFKITDFHFCVSGWKAAKPDTLNMVQFESPEGFLSFLKTNNSNN